MISETKIRTLQQEVQKKNPFELPEEEAYLNLLRTQETLYDHFSKMFKRYGITQPQYNVLRILRGIGGDGVRTLDLVKPMVNRVPDITRLVDRLERAGLISRNQTKEDRRVVLVSITQKGLELLEKLDEPVQFELKKQLSHLEPGELETLNQLLLKARNSEAYVASSNIKDVTEPTASSGKVLN